MRGALRIVALCLFASRALAAVGTEPVRIDLDPPTSIGSASNELAFVTGRALAQAAGGSGLDLVLALDTSASSDEPAYESHAAAADSASLLARFLRWVGIERRREPGVTIFSEQLRAARAALDDLDPATSRVAIVVLAGESVGGSGGPVVALPLSTDFERARLVLAWLETEGPDGTTDWVAGLGRAVALLVGVDERDPATALARRQRALLVFSDARLAAHEASRPELEAVLSLAVRADVRIDALVFGEEAQRGAPLLRRFARTTQGRIVGVTRAGDVLQSASRFEHARLAALEVRNDTLAEPARALYRRADGSFGSLVRLAPGGNRISVVARGWDGRQSRVEIEIERESLSEAGDLHALGRASLDLRGRLLRSLHREQLIESAVKRERELKISGEPTPADTLPAKAAPVD